MKISKKYKKNIYIYKNGKSNWNIFGIIFIINITNLFFIKLFSILIWKLSPKLDYWIGFQRYRINSKMNQYKSKSMLATILMK